MAIQRMFHPDHGYDHAYDNAAVKRMQENGWKIQSDKEFKEVLAAKAGDEPEAEEAPKKRGPKPKADA